MLLDPQIESAPKSPEPKVERAAVARRGSKQIHREALDVARCPRAKEGSIYPMRLYAGYVFDLDGTLYRGAEPIPGAVEAVVELKRRGAQVRYLTNNSSQTREFFAEKLTSMGFPAAQSEIESSGLGTAKLLKEWSVTRVFVVGEPGLVTTLREGEIEVANAGADGIVRAEKVSVDAVVAGIHHGFTYQIMAAAMDCILNGARFIATNRDATFPLEGGRLTPGAGSIVAGIATCSGREPYVVGKPNPYLVELAMSDMGLKPIDVLVVGDRDDTDLESGRRAGCATHLVLTGVDQSGVDGQSFSADLKGLL